MKALAEKAGVSPRTLRYYLRGVRGWGLAGLAPRPRSDKGKRHGISEQVVQLIEGIRLSHLDYPVRAVYEAACERARSLGLVEPSRWQVRDIWPDPEAVRLLADGREDEYRNRYRLTYRIPHNGPSNRLSN